MSYLTTERKSCKTQVNNSQLAKAKKHTFMTNIAVFFCRTIYNVSTQHLITAMSASLHPYSLCNV